jgi:hypothetical protein
MAKPSENRQQRRGTTGGRGQGRIANCLVQLHQCRLRSHQVHSSGTLRWKPNYLIHLKPKADSAHMKSTLMARFGGKSTVSYSYNKANSGRTRYTSMIRTGEKPIVRYTYTKSDSDHTKSPLWWPALVESRLTQTVEQKLTLVTSSPLRWA